MHSARFNHYIYVYISWCWRRKKFKSARKEIMAYSFDKLDNKNNKEEPMESLSIDLYLK